MLAVVSEMWVGMESLAQTKLLRETVISVTLIYICTKAGTKAGGGGRDTESF